MDIRNTEVADPRMDWDWDDSVSMGLNEWASDYVLGTQVYVYTEHVTRKYPDGRSEERSPRAVYECSVRKEFSGELINEKRKHPLYKYTFPDGVVLREAVQKSDYDGEVYYHLALKDEAGSWLHDSLWQNERGIQFDSDIDEDE